MRVAITLCIAMFISGCASTYERNNLSEPSVKLLKGKAVIISTPSNGFYEHKEYAGSGKMTALAVQVAFAKFTNTTTVSAECKVLECLKKSSASNFDYYVIPEILHWEDRATEWSGIPDKIKVKLSIYEGKTWKEMGSTLIAGTSKWASLGGDHPQDLLPEPVNKYVESLY